MKDLTCRHAIAEDFPAIDKLKSDYFAKMGKEDLNPDANKEWVVCVDGLGAIRGAYAYVADMVSKYILVYDFYVDTVYAIPVMESDLLAVGRYLRFPEIYFGTDAENTAWNRALQKHGYLPNTIIYKKEI